MVLDSIPACVTTPRPTKLFLVVRSCKGLLGLEPWFPITVCDIDSHSFSRAELTLRDSRQASCVTCQVRKIIRYSLNRDVFISFYFSKRYVSPLECKNFIFIPPSHQHFQAIRLVVLIDQNNQSDCLKMLVRWWDDYEIYTFS